MPASITITQLGGDGVGTAAGGWRAGVWSLNAEAGVEGYWGGAKGVEQ